MRYSIAVKFLAVCLAALLLLGVLSSAVGIIAMTAMDLYQNSVEDLYNQTMDSTRQQFAVNLVHRYASLHLGDLPEQYLRDYYGTNWIYNTFQYGHFYYTIYDEQGRAVESTMADAPEGGTNYQMTVTNVCYRSLVDITEPDQLQQTIPPTSAETSVPASETEEPESEAANSPRDVLVQEDTYFDYELQRPVRFTFVYRDLPPYTVELYLMPEAVPEEYAWSILRSIWSVRNELFYVLGACILLFATCVVYLCVAAGRQKEGEQIRAGGLNRIPLDLYLVILILTVAACLVLAPEVAGYLLRTAPKVLIHVLALAGYGCCLLSVGFGFACTAQFKMADRFWWHNSITGRCMGLTTWISGRVWKGCRWSLIRLPAFLSRWFGWIFRWTKKIVLWLWAVCRKAVLWAWNMIRAVFTWLGRKLGQFMGLLPVMWQWLLTAAVMLVLAVVASHSDSLSGTIIAIALYLAIVIYSATAFGLLLESTKRMSRGVLKLKISDQFLIGAFREFAGDLNALAGVAAVAAEKQLRSERMKTELITNVSHDIKTPLTSIINYVDLLQKPHTQEDEEAYLEVLSRQSGQLKKLIDDLMEMSKASTGNLSVDIISMDAAEAINQALGEFSEKLEKAQLIPLFRQPENPVYMKADGRLTWRVLSNLLSNACKYALPGTRLYIDVAQEDGNVLISVKNISREALNISAEELMERFVRGDVSRNTEGSGLGLNIAQSLMELQRGRLLLVVDGDLFKATLVFPAVRIE